MTKQEMKLMIRAVVREELELMKNGLLQGIAKVLQSKGGNQAPVRKPAVEIVRKPQQPQKRSVPKMPNPILQSIMEQTVPLQAHRESYNREVSRPVYEPEYVEDDTYTGYDEYTDYDTVRKEVESQGASLHEIADYGAKLLLMEGYDSGKSGMGGVPDWDS